MMSGALSIRVRGQVQGVGFRPHVWKLAREYAIRGRVLNDPEGVLIEAAGLLVQDFVAALSDRVLPLARIDSVELSAYDGELPDGFEIAPSRGEGGVAGVPPDAAACAHCRTEIRGAGRRRGYTFTSCAECGPRFTILSGLPYDRAKTTMAAFPMCQDCAGEYADPSDHRFHAQPIACPACGPRLWLEADGKEIHGDPVTEAARRLSLGETVAVKGLGGFHLACDAANSAAVERLRARKRRPSKPFALMGHEAMLRRVATLGEAELRLLRDSAAPIVLARSLGVLPEALAPGLAELGVMLPHAPLHHLLLDAFGGVLVMTSGNLSGEPQVTSNADARRKLSAFADLFLMHDRDIARRLDDSVERASPPMPIRRARGRVPGTIALPPGFEDAPQVLALGGQMKAAICLIKDGKALVGHHLGDLGDALCADEFTKAVADYAALFDLAPQAIAVDAHPDYRATRDGKAMAKRSGIPAFECFHHHAHLAACLADNRWPLDGGKVAGIILDGAGLGPDGTVWGGEVLLGDYHGVERRFHLAPAPLIGGDRAAREPWRNALVRLDHAGFTNWADGLFAGKPLALARQAVASGLNAPLSSSAGRLFDAAAACLGICPDGQSYEGEAAMRLEASAASCDLAEDLMMPSGGVLDPAPLFHALHRLAGLCRSAEAAGLFHAGLARGFANAARQLVEGGEAKAVALSGGCFQNAVLLKATLAALNGLPVLVHREIPANDGGLALGQSVIAAARMQRQK